MHWSYLQVKKKVVNLHFVIFPAVIDGILCTGPHLPPSDGVCYRNTGLSRWAAEPYSPCSQLSCGLWIMLQTWQCLPGLHRGLWGLLQTSSEPLACSAVFQGRCSCSVRCPQLQYITIPDRGVALMGNQSQSNWESCCCVKVGFVWIPSSTSWLCSLDSCSPSSCSSLCRGQYKQPQSWLLSVIAARKSCSFCTDQMQ